jgi:hypothetical protein
VWKGRGFTAARSLWAHVCLRSRHPPGRWRERRRLLYFCAQWGGGRLEVEEGEDDERGGRERGERDCGRERVAQEASPAGVVQVQLARDRGHDQLAPEALPHLHDRERALTRARTLAQPGPRGARGAGRACSDHSTWRDPQRCARAASRRAHSLRHTCAQIATAHKDKDPRLSVRRLPARRAECRRVLPPPPARGAPPLPPLPAPASLFPAAAAPGAHYLPAQRWGRLGSGRCSRRGAQPTPRGLALPRAPRVGGARDARGAGVVKERWGRGGKGFSRDVSG